MVWKISNDLYLEKRYGGNQASFNQILFSFASVVIFSQLSLFILLQRLFEFTIRCIIYIIWCMTFIIEIYFKSHRQQKGRGILAIFKSTNVICLDILRKVKLLQKITTFRPTHKNVESSAQT